MAIELFSDGESGESIRTKINANFVNLDDRLTAREEIDLPALLGLLAPPIVSQPSGGMVAAGSTRTLSVTTGPQVGQAPTLFQWQSLSGSEWSDIAGATSSTYTTPVLTEDVTLRVKLSNAFGDTYSTIVTVSVLGFAVQPQSGDFYVGNDATLTATSNLAGASYQWQEWDGDAWQNIAGATSGTYSVNSLALGDDGREFRCVISISGVQAISNAATIAVFGITTQPTEEVTLEGVADTYMIATNQTSATYQWQRSTDGGTTWSDLAAETDSSLAVSGTQANNGRKYRCIVSFRGLTLTSNVVTRHVLFFVTHPQSAEVFEGTSETLSSAVSVSGATYQWQQSTDGVTWDDVSLATSSSYTITNAPTSLHQEKFRVKATAGSVNLASSSATITIWNPVSLGSSLTAWWNPRAGKYTERTGLSATTVAGNGDPVGTWVASNGTHYLYAESDAARPTVDSAGMSFSVDDALRHSAQLFRKTGLAYLFFAIEVSMAPDQATLFCDRISTTGASRRVIINVRHTAEFRTRLFTRTSDSESSGTPVFASDVYTYAERFVLIAEINWQDGKTAIWKNKTKLAETTIPIAGETDDTDSLGAYLGSNFNAGYFDWNCFDHAILKPSEPLSQSEREKLVDFMLVRMGA